MLDIVKCVNSEDTKKFSAYGSHHETSLVCCTIYSTLLSFPSGSVQSMYSLTSLFTVWHVNEQQEIYPEMRRIAGDIETDWELLGSTDCPQAGKIKQECLMQKEKKNRFRSPSS